ncbi:M48 family metalloprotease [Micromonospora sp. NPDC126480]|uniref:M48 family metalloprotease n=1 Tax=Micromonospora sp. NPDC126480 TaxID=3155312 RepID=UPI003329AA59
MTAPEDRPRPLLWLYGLVAVSLSSVGMAAGFTFFDGPVYRALRYGMTVQRCEALHRGSAGALGECLAEQVRLRGTAVFGGALLLLAGTLALTIVVPWRDLRRLRRFGRIEVPAAGERFAELCQRHGLSGRRAPRLWVAGPAVRHAFTTSLPAGRPTVVIPARLALDPGDRFDAVVTHELAHVLARDVTWISAVRGPAWLFVPVFALASVPMLARPTLSPLPVAALVGTALWAATVAVLAAALLRLREHEADRYAAGAGGQSALAALFARAPAPHPAQPWSRVRRLLARHPDPVARAGALRGGARAYEGGLVQALAVGFVAGAAMNTVVLLAVELVPRLYAWSGGALAALTGAAVLALLFPSLVRRGRARHADPQWWRSVAGAGGGVVLGTLLVPVVFRATRIPYPLVRPGSSGRAVLAVAVLGLTAAGVVALAASVAELAARSDRAVHGRLAVGASGLAAVAGLWPVGLTAAALDDTGNLRHILTYGLARYAWPALALGLLVVYALLSRRQVPRGRRPWLVALATATVAGVAAILVQPASSGLTDQLRAQQQRWWICAAAGVVVLVVVALSTPWPYGWSSGVLAATATTAAATAAHYGHGWLTGRPAEPDLFAADVAVAPVWLGCATVLLAALLVPLAARWRGFPAPVRIHRLTGAGTAVSVTTAVAVAVGVAGVPGGVAENSRQRQLAALSERYAPARRVLTPQQAERVAQSSVLVIPLTWKVADSGSPEPGIVSSGVSVSDPACEPLVRESFLAAGAAHLRATGIRTYTSDPGDGGLTYTDVTVTVRSYDAPVGEAILVAARDARRACPAFTLDESSTALKFQVRAAPPPPFGELSWRYDSTMSATVAGYAFTGTFAYAMLAVGYSVITVYMSAQQEPLDEELLRRILATTEHTLLRLG